MCDVKKFEKIYEDIKTLQPEDTLQLVLEAETEEQRSFYEMVGVFLLQMKQRQVIERNLLQYFGESITFNQETTLCGKSILNNVAKAKDRGYFIELHYIGVEDVDIAKERVAVRVKQGGHGIAEKDIERRYFCATLLLFI